MFPEEITNRSNNIQQYITSLGISTELLTDTNLMLQAFVHKSYSADYKNTIPHNERLEFLGDGILGAVINTLLFHNHPEMEESDMTLYKIALVREETLADVARDITLADHLFISQGEQRMGGKDKDAILSDALEALIGYIHIDAGHEASAQFIEQYIYSKMKAIQAAPVKSYKSALQELIQKQHKLTPSYHETEANVDEKGNVLEYKSEIYLFDTKKAEGFGPSKKKAQEEAAKNYFTTLTAGKNSGNT